MPFPVSRIGLGTVQFGLDYGISNSTGQIPEEKAREILYLAAQCGIRVLDTAALYGASEAVLGRHLSTVSAFKVVTKTVQFDCEKLDASHVARLDEAFSGSLRRLRTNRVYALLIHRVEDLLKPGSDRVFDWLLSLKESEKVAKIGVSLYMPEQLDAVFDRYSLDLVQLPMNVLDRSFERSGQLNLLRQRGVEIHVRSVFLQGVLLMEPDKLPFWFEPIREHLCRYRAYLAARGLTPLQGALASVLALPDPSLVLCGVTSRAELQEILDAVMGVDQDAVDGIGQFAIEDSLMINPSRWRLH